ncbi:hypothetical protein [Halorarius halobius]|uniref:hypothetical protein n=1 Tax=Halorarius halobius TaxID=2962671 RepID=UPI0020CE52EC|nr:hypothetical protein [Halorarius halobius]
MLDWFVTRLLATGNGWHDADTFIRVLVLFVGATLFGDKLASAGLNTVGSRRIRRTIRRVRRQVTTRMTRLRPGYQVRRRLPFSVLSAYPLQVTAESWRDMTRLAIGGATLMLLDVLAIWVGIPWATRQVGLPIWLGVTVAVGVWGLSRPATSSGSLMAGGLLAGVWLAGYPQLALMVPPVAILGGMGTLFIMKGTAELVEFLDLKTQRVNV